MHAELPRGLLAEERPDFSAKWAALALEHRRFAVRIRRAFGLPPGAPILPPSPTTQGEIDW